jgi:transposase-like protein
MSPYGVRADGIKDILGLWIEQNEGAKFWLRVMNEIKNAASKMFSIAVVDGLKGFPDAIQAVFPGTTVQACIVHLLRHNLAVFPGFAPAARLDGWPGDFRRLLRPPALSWLRIGLRRA